MEERVTHRRVEKLVFAALVAAVISVLVGASPAHAVGGWSEKADDTWMTNGTVFDTALSEDGSTLYVGGRFTVARENPSGTPGASVGVRNLTAIDVATGEVVRTWRPQITGADGENPVIRSIAVKNGKVYVGGIFSLVNGEPRSNLAAVDPTTGAVDPAFIPAVTNQDPTLPAEVISILPGDSKLYVGGEFTAVNGKARARLAALDPVTGALDTAWKPKSSRVVQDLEFSSDRASIFVAGRFGSITGSEGTVAARKNVARVFTDTGNVHPWAIPAGVIGETDQTAWDLLVTPTRLYAGFGDKGPNYAAAFRLDDGDTGSQLWRFNTPGDVYSFALTPDNSRLFVGGHFGINRLRQTACGRPVQGIVSLNPDNGQALCDWIPPLQPEFDNGNGPWDMTMIGGEQVWVGGGFTHVSGVNQSNLARFSYDPTLKLVNYAPKVDLNGLRRGGLDATYFDNVDFTGTQVSRTDASVNFDFGNGSPDPAIGVNTFSSRWTGQIEAPSSGEYTFTTRSDDGVRLLIEGEMVVDNWNDHGPTDNSGTITLEAGRRYDVDLDHYENGGGAVIQLFWQPPGGAREIVPSTSLYFSGGVNKAVTYPGGAPVPVADADLAVTDPDDLNVRSARVTLANRPDGNAEILSADTSGTTISAAYDPQTGVLSLSGAASKADYQRVLSTAAYANTAASRTAGDRTVTFTVNDGYVDSGSATARVSVQAATP